MTNPQSDERISAYLDNDLSKTESAEFEALLERCAELRRTVDELRALRQELQSLPKVKLGANFAQRVMQHAAAAKEESAQDMASQPVSMAPQPVSLTPSESRAGLVRGLFWGGAVIAAAVALVVFNQPADFDRNNGIAHHEEPVRESDPTDTDEGTDTPSNDEIAKSKARQRSRESNAENQTGQLGGTRSAIQTNGVPENGESADRSVNLGVNLGVNRSVNSGLDKGDNSVGGRGGANPVNNDFNDGVGNSDADSVENANATFADRVVDSSVDADEATDARRLAGGAQPTYIVYVDVAPGADGIVRKELNDATNFRYQNKFENNSDSNSDNKALMLNQQIAAKLAEAIGTRDRSDSELKKRNVEELAVSPQAGLVDTSSLLVQASPNEIRLALAQLSDRADVVSFTMESRVNSPSLIAAKQLARSEEKADALIGDHVTAEPTPEPTTAKIASQVHPGAGPRAAAFGGGNFAQGDGGFGAASGAPPVEEAEVKADAASVPQRSLADPFGGDAAEGEGVSNDESVAESSPAADTPAPAGGPVRRAMTPKPAAVVNGKGQNGDEFYFKGDPKSAPRVPQAELRGRAGLHQLAVEKAEADKMSKDERQKALETLVNEPEFLRRTAILTKSSHEPVQVLFVFRATSNMPTNPATAAEQTSPTERE